MSTRLYAVVARNSRTAKACSPLREPLMQRVSGAWMPTRRSPSKDSPRRSGMRRTYVPLCTLLGGIAGGLTGYGMQFYSAAIDYPLNVGGRPLHSWPAFVPITFELTVLFAALSAAISMLAFNGLPRPHHPIFEMPHFEERNASHFYLAIEARDGLFQAEEVRAFLAGQKPGAVWEVEA